MAQTKNCEHCGEAFHKSSQWSARQWSARRFCSTACSGVAASIAKRFQSGTVRDAFDKRMDQIDRGAGCWEWQGTIEGYGYGVLDHNGKRYRAHVLALEFDGRPVGELVACHTCDNPRCVRPSHLYPGTPKNNVHDAKSRGRLARGERHGCAKLTEQQVREIRSLPPMPYSHIARMYGVSRPTITRAILGKNWGHVQ